MDLFIANQYWLNLEDCKKTVDNIFSNKDFTTLVVKDNNLIKGFVTYNPLNEEKTRWKISGLAVASNFRKKGFGTDLLRTAIENIKQSGGKMVWIDVLADNQNAKNLYNKLGFKVVAKDGNGKIETMRCTF